MRKNLRAKNLNSKQVSWVQREFVFFSTRVKGDEKFFFNVQHPHHFLFAHKASNKANAQPDRNPPGLLFHLISYFTHSRSTFNPARFLPLARSIHLIKASRGKDHFSFFSTVYTAHSVVQLCTDCGNLSPSVSERSSPLFGARFARARVCEHEG